MSWFGLLQPLMRHFRARRAQRIRRAFPGIESMDILDVGGSAHFWTVAGPILRPGSVTILNITDNATANATGKAIPIVIYDGQAIPFADRSIDLVLCNSVIEHVGNRDNLAREIRRVAISYVVQTPAFAFPVEPHFVAPFIHWLPRPLGRVLCRVTPRAFSRGRPVTEVFDEVRLLTRKELQRLFPAARVETERFLGLPKSYLAFGYAGVTEAEPSATYQRSVALEPLATIRR